MRGLRFVVIAALALAGCANGKLSADAAPPDDAMVDACAPATETCNGKDEDCDGVADNGFELGGPCTVGTGACQVTGTIVCTADGTGTECSKKAGDGTAERCDGVDNDCDGKTDEDFPLSAMCDGPDADLCEEGMVICDGAGGTTCSDLTGDTVETCNVKDDDCDGNVDEGFDVGAACDGADADQCKEGVRACDTSGAAVCTDMTADTVELCNGADDDCDGTIDNGFTLGAGCTVGVGACARSGVTVCDGAGTGTTCNATQGSPTAELCGDGIDQDCNGADVGCPINDGAAGAIDVSAGGTWSVDLSAAHDDAHASCSGSGGRDVFYDLTLGAPEVVYLDTIGSNFDSTIAIFNGACTSLGAEVGGGCSDDSCAVRQSQLALSLPAGTYCIVADQYSSSQTAGALVLDVVRGGRDGLKIPAATGSQSGNTCTGSNVSGSSSCQSFATGGDLGYFFTSCPATTVSVDASTCGASWDTVVYLRHGAASAGDVACSDDSCGLQSSFTGGVITQAGLNWLIVDGYNGACGTYTLSYTFH